MLSEDEEVFFAFVIPWSYEQDQVTFSLCQESD